jgi:hypothetical protein
LIYELTESAFLVGLNGLLRTIPFLLMSLYAGTVADRVDRRKLLFWVEVVVLGLNVAITVLIASGLVEIWHVYVYGIAVSMAGAFENPAQQGLLPHLVPRQDLMTAVTLNSMLRRSTQVVGPALGGLAVAHLGVAATYGIQVVAFSALVLSLGLMRSTNPVEGRSRAAPVTALLEGIRYVRGDSVVATLLLLEAVMSVFGSFNSMLVVFAREIYHVGADGFGILQGAAGLGSFAGAIALSLRGDVEHKGRLIVFGGMFFSLSIVAFSFSSWFPLAVVLLALTGVVDVIVGATRNTVLQLITRGPMLGRVMSLNAMTTRGLGQMGGFTAGSLGSVIGVQGAVGVGALICFAATVIVATRVPQLRDLTGTGPPDGSSSSPRGRQVAHT